MGYEPNPVNHPDFWKQRKNQFWLDRNDITPEGKKKIINGLKKVNRL